MWSQCALCANHSTGPRSFFSRSNRKELVGRGYLADKCGGVLDRLCGFCFGCCRLLHSRICKHGRKSTRSTTRGSCARSPWGQPAKRAPQGEVGALARISAICKLPVVPICRRRRRLQVRQIRIIFFDIPPQARGAHRDRHSARGGDAVDAKVLTDERRCRGRAKSCGPGAPMQALSPS